MSKKRPPQGYKAKKPTPPPDPAIDNGAVIDDAELPIAEIATPGTTPPSAETTAVESEDTNITSVSPDDTDPTLEAIDDGGPVADFPKWEYSLIDVETEPVDERDLKLLLRDWRRGRATKTIGQVLSDGYVTIFAAAVIIAMVSGAVFQAQGTAASCDTASCMVGRTLLPWVALGAVFCLTALAAKIFGPIVASAAEGFWLMDAPIRRGRLLVGRFIGVVVAAGLIAALLGGLLAALTGYELVAILQWALAMGVGGAGLTALASFEQTYGRTWIISIVQWLAGLVAIGVLFIIVSVSAGWFGLSMPTVPNSREVVWVAVAGGVLLLVMGGLALSRLGMIHRARLVSGGSLVSGMQGAAFAMDFGLMRDILVERDSQRKGHVRPARGAWKAEKALVWREMQRVWRYPKRIMVVMVSIVVPYAVAALGFRNFSPFISALILFVGFVPMLGSMRVLTRTKGLARTFPLSTTSIRGALVVVPAVVAIFWSIATTPAYYGIGEHVMDLGRAWVNAALTAAAGLLAAIRWVSAKPADYSSPMMQTGFGAMPPGLMFNLIRGFDVAIIITGPLLLGWSPWISVVIAFIVGIALSGAYNMDEMQQMQKEMQKEKDRAKNGGGTGGTTTKQKIAPPRGYGGPTAR